jgi:hypothetical protein
VFSGAVWSSPARETVGSEEVSVDEALLAPGKVLVEVELSVVSGGTEVANLPAWT